MVAVTLMQLTHQEQAICVGKPPMRDPPSRRSRLRRECSPRLPWLQMVRRRGLWAVHLPATASCRGFRHRRRGGLTYGDIARFVTSDPDGRYRSGCARKAHGLLAQRHPYAMGYGFRQRRGDGIGNLAVLIQVGSHAGAAAYGANKQMAVGESLKPGALPRCQVAIFSGVIQNLAAPKGQRWETTVKAAVLRGIFRLEAQDNVGGRI